MEQVLLSEKTVNTELAPVFVPGYTGPVSLGYGQRSLARQKLNVSDIEKGFAVLCAELLSLKIGQELFIEKLPDTLRDGCVVTLLPGDPGGNCDYWNGRILFAGRARQKEKIRQYCSRLLVSLPLLKWLTVNSALQQNAVTFCCFSVGEPVSGEKVNAAGTEGYGTQIVFDLKVCVTPPEPEFV